MLANPLRAVFSSFSCSTCGLFYPEGQRSENVGFLCARCLSAEAGGRPRELRKAYASLIYGEAAGFACGALALGQSLLATGTPHDRVLLHTPDVPPETRAVLAEFWRMVEVPYISSAPDLHKAPCEQPKFKEIFTKLQLFNPQALPFDRVVFLDSDTLVLRRVDELFEVRPPAAMSNSKTDGARRGKPPPLHGVRMDPRCCYINAGTMVLAPSWPLFELLAADVQASDPTWHTSAWSPEQNYLSRVLAGEWSHISQVYNLEVQLHSGVPLSETWERAAAEDVAVAHFSGSLKVWDHEPDRSLPPHTGKWVQEVWDRLPPQTRAGADVRCQALAAAWHRTFAAALGRLRGRATASDMGPAWAATLRTGDAAALCGAAAGVALSPAAAASTLPGEEVVVEEGEQPVVRYLGEVARVRADGEVVVWRAAPPEAAAMRRGALGLCTAIGLATRVCSRAAADKEPWPGLGAEAAVWSGEGHELGAVVAARGSERLLAFKRRAALWLPVEDLRQTRAEALQCTICLARDDGAFDEDGLWTCVSCAQ